MLGATMMDRFGRHVEDANVVAVDNRRSSNRDLKLLKKPAKQTTLGDNIGHNTILCLSTGVGDSGVAFGGPGYQVVAKKNTVACCLEMGQPTQSASEYAIRDSRKFRGGGQC